MSVPRDLLDKFDDMIANRGCRNRSGAIRGRIVEREWEEVMGGVTPVYGPHQYHLSDKLTVLQYKSHQLVVSPTHLHVDADNPLGLIAVKGHGRESRAWRVSQSALGA
ncbi:nickel-responsive transcriptional regulator NikR [Candidatus Bipolaricaulota bacterium]|nr:nickel-responsive transcriptional regulator NikR [Candidatus Bipolaricaulota bacterium]